MLVQLLEQVYPVDFRALAGLKDDRDKLTTAHYVVVVIEEALALAARNQCDLCRRQGVLHFCNGSYWKHLDEPTLRRFLRQAAERLGVPPMKARFYGFAEQLYKQFIETASLPVSSPITRNVVHVNLRNDTFDISLNTQKLRAPAPDDFLTHELPFAYEPGAVATRWQAFSQLVTSRPWARSPSSVAPKTSC